MASFSNPTFLPEQQGQKIPMNQYPVTQQPLGQQQQQFPQNGEPPPPYFQQQEHTVNVNVSFREPDLITGPLQNLEKYYIRKTGLSTRAATDASNNLMFTYSEQVIVNTAPILLAKMSIVDNKGAQFLTADLDKSGTKVNSGSTQLGVFDPIVINATTYNKPLSGSSSLGLGYLQFLPKGMAPTAASGCCCCCGSSGGEIDEDKGFEIMLNYQPVGKISLSGGFLVEFQPQLDPRIKAMIVIGSFLLVNVFG